MNCIQGESGSQTANGNGRRSRRDSSVQSDRSREGSQSSQGSGSRQRMVRFSDRTPPERDRSTARSTTSYPPRTASVPRQSGGPPPWQSNQGSWNRPRGDFSASNRPPWQGYNRQTAAPGDRWRNQGQNFNQPRAGSSNEWPTNRNSFPWGTRQRSWSDSSSVALRDTGQQQRQWGPPLSRPPPGATDATPRGRENRPPMSGLSLIHI